MFDFLKRKKTAETEAEITIPNDTSTKTPFFARLKQGLSKTRSTFMTGMATLFLGKKELNTEVLNEIETALYSADVGVETTQQLIATLTQKLARKELNDTDAAFQCLRDEMIAILQPCSVPFSIPDTTKPYVILMVGINGSGKTTTIGKLTHYFKQAGCKIMLAAGDTFRAAAIEQLKIWGERNAVPVIAQQPGADTAAVIYDAMGAASARQIDILLADTAGRLHTQSHLMAELQKIKRVVAKINPAAPHETWIVLDASLGQNALTQVKQFHDAMGITGIIITKLDGTAKGGILFAIAKQTAIPIRFIGVGEGIDDLRPFVAEEFVTALFATE